MSWKIATALLVFGPASLLAALLTFISTPDDALPEWLKRRRRS